jgi:hypothetical protein
MAREARLARGARADGFDEFGDLAVERIEAFFNSTQSLEVFAYDGLDILKLDPAHVHRFAGEFLTPFRRGATLGHRPSLAQTAVLNNVPVIAPGPAYSTQAFPSAITSATLAGPIPLTSSRSFTERNR